MLSYDYRGWFLGIHCVAVRLSPQRSSRPGLTILLNCRWSEKQGTPSGHANYKPRGVSEPPIAHALYKGKLRVCIVLIERVQIEDGFLNSVDIRFAEGLNVLIGARGTGKTSLIELIRFALDAAAFTEDAARRGKQQALSVLQGGQVTVVLRDGEDRFAVTRGARDEAPRSTRSIPPVTVLAQSEIEAVGAQASGRLHLIDRFLLNRTDADRRQSSLTSTIRSLTAEIGGLRNELRSINEQILGMQTIRPELVDAVAEQQDLLKSIAATAKDRKELEDLQARAAVLGVRSAVYERTATTFSNFRFQLLRVAEGLREIEEWPDSAGVDDLLKEVRRRKAQAAQALRTTVDIIESVETEVQELIEQNTADRLFTDERARVSRRAFDELQAGAGALTRKVEILTERQAQLAALEDLAKELSGKIAELQGVRRHSFEELEEVRAERFRARMQVATQLQMELGPEIKIDVTESGMTTSYANIIAAALRGSGLHYNTLAPLFAANMSPLELVEAVESSDVPAITEAVDVTTERAMNVVAYLSQRNLADLIAAPVDDTVELALLDGLDYKDSDNLSIGQRCTVVLPILLTGHGGLLVIDQPEDHLDNAFITETLVERLHERRPGDQFILASHNANIPVLGEADFVIRLGSDGRRGFVEHAGKLDDPTTVQAITSVMEGGVEAFERRATFYHDVLGGMCG